MRRIAFLTLLQLACAFLWNTSAQTAHSGDNARTLLWEPPRIVDFPSASKATAPKEMITRLRVSNEAVVLEHTQLTAVQRRLGGTIGHRGDAGDSLDWLCFHSTDVRGSVLWLMSGEIDGGTVGGFHWAVLDARQDVDKRCRTLPKGGGVTIPVALRLGMSEAEVLRVFGQPTARLDNALLYLHEHGETIRGQAFTAMNTVAVLLRGGVVSGIEVWKSTTS